MFMYDLDQIVFYLKDNIVHSAPILSSMCVENIRVENVCTKEQEDFYFSFGKNKVQYATCHGTFDESELFESRESLAYYILKNE